MPTAAQLKRRPSPEAMQLLLDEIAPGGRVIAITRLRGGISCGMHGVNITERSGAKLRIVVRRYNDYWAKNEPQIAHREFRILKALEKAGIPAPRPIWGDTDDTTFGTPTIVQTWLPGRANIAPTNVDTYLNRLAEALAQLHQADFDSTDAVYLKMKSLEIAENIKSEKLIARCLQHPAGEHILKTLDESLPTMSTPTLIHNDFWPGNTVWSRGKLTGITDWENPVLGEPAFDVAYCRMDLTLIFGLAAANQFRSHYEDVTGARLNAPHFWDLLIATQELPDPADHYLPGYRDLGRTDITKRETRRRYQEFITQALAQSS